MEKLTEETALKSLPDWQKVKGRAAITRTFYFKDFNEAFGWMTRIALVCEKMDHHPEWCNIWNKVDVILTTHDAKGITQKDIELAQEMEKYAF